jgi:hypothetical protein
MARKNLFNIADADTGRVVYEPPSRSDLVPPPPTTTQASPKPSRRRQEYREGKRAVMFFLSEEAFSQMHVLLARQGRKKVQRLMEELIDDWFRRENAPRLLR